MCGIAGILRFDGGPVAPADIEAMLGVLEHRGPDATGLWFSDGVGLGHKRLSIIDVAGSPQPMSSPSGRLHITFNGEILNYAALRARMDRPFRTDGDTEVLLATFDRDGPAGLASLHGQFAFAAYDSTAGELHLVRDRMGILPLYYVVAGGRIAFASEIKALLAVGAAAEIDRASLHEYLGHRSVHGANTMFAGIRKVPPGHHLRVDRHGRLEVRPYWSLSNDPEPMRVTDAEAVERVAAALTDSVDEALVADVPVGAYLSGGLDSSLIVALAARARPGNRLSTYSAGFLDSPSDERPWARRVSALLGTDHHEVLVGPDDFTELWERLSWFRDAPLAEPADVAMFRLAEAARHDVKVVISGEGSDELFAGYPKYRVARLADLLGTIPAPVRGPALGAVGRLLPARFHRQSIALRAMAAPDRGGRLRTWFASFSEAERDALLGRSDRPTDPWDDDGRGDPVRRMLYADAQGWLPDNLLHTGDRMSMASSVELRPPFLDARLVDLAFALPSSVKLRGQTTKWVLKEVARRHLPDEVVDRRKVGFTVPLDTWFRGGLRDTAWDVLTARGSLVGELMPAARIRQLLVDHDSGRRDEQIRLWTLIGLEMWHRAFFSGPVRIGASPAAPAPPSPWPPPRSGS